VKVVNFDGDQVQDAASACGAKARPKDSEGS